MTRGSPQAPARVLVVSDDAEVAAVLCLHLPRAGYDPICLPGPELLDAVLPVVTPHAIVLVLPPTPAPSWGPALIASASAAQAGVRVVLVAPAREIVEPLAAVAGAERALSRAEVLARPLSVLEGFSIRAGPPPLPSRPSASPREASASGGAAGPMPLARIDPAAATSRIEPTPPIDLLSLIDEELADDRAQRPPLTRIEVNVSLVSEHNFYVGATRRIDSGGVFISTMLPPALGTPVQIRLGLPDARKVDVEGEVAFLRDRDATGGRQPAGCGVKLKGIPAAVADAIDRFLAARPPIVWAP